RGQRSRNIARINEIIKAAQESDEDGFHKPQRRKRRRKPKPRPVGDGADTDLDDTGYTALSSDESSEDDDDTAKITNEELADSLPSKTVPTKKRSPLTTKAKSKQQRPRKRSRSTVEEVFDDEAPLLPRSRPRQAFPAIIKKASVKRNPIYCFYEEINVGANGKAGAPGDKHYCCYHGSHKVFTITKAMNHS
ncbi:hypothetical protein H0H92_012496, partial [Tricholoma furcatifolium]